MSPNLRVHRFNTQVPLAKRASIQQTLFRFQQRLSALGYDTYLIHARPSKEAGASRGVNARDVTLVPQDCQVLWPPWHMARLLRAHPQGARVVALRTVGGSALP